MKKLLSLVLVIALLMAVLPLAPVTAASVDELAGLASYFPADTAVYVGLRTDDDYINNLDMILGGLRDALPTGTIPPVTLPMLLDMAVMESGLGGDFGTSVRSWLGDFAAVGILSLESQFDDDFSNDSEVPFAAVASITDRAGAEAFLSSLMADPVASGNAELTTIGDYTAYVDSSSEDSNTAFLVNDNVLILVGYALDAITGEMDGSLLDNQSMLEAAMQLPADSYNILVYTNLTGILEAQMAQVAMMSEMGMDMGFDPSALMGMMPGATTVVAGFTVLDGRTLTIDAVTMTDMAAEGMVMPEYTPVSTDFAQHIPSGTPLVIWGANLASAYEAQLANLGMMAEMMQSDEDAEGMDLQQAVGMVNFTLRGLLGLELDDIIGWMHGDYALWLGFNPDFNGDMMEPNTLPVDFGLIADASADPAAAATIVAELAANLPDAIEQFEVEGVVVSSEGDLVVLTLQSPDMPFPIEIVAGANDAVFALGTRNAVDAALNPGAGILADAAAVEAQEYFLPNTNAVLYINPQGLAPLAGFASAAGASADEMDTVNSLINLFSSSIISTTVNEDGTVQWARATISLNLGE